MPSDYFVLDRVTQDFTVAGMQDQSAFSAASVSTSAPTKDQQAHYYVLNQGYWNAIEMKKRGPNEESAGGNYKWSSAEYFCDRFAVHTDDDYMESAKLHQNISTEKWAGDWLANQVLMYREKIFVDLAMQPSTWTTDWDGVASGASLGTSILQWNDGSADAQKDVQMMKRYIKAKTGRLLNGKWIAVAGSHVDGYLTIQAAFRNALNGSQFTDMKTMEQKLSAWLGVDEYYVLDGIYNSAKEGQTASMAYIGNTKDFALFYRSNDNGDKVMTALKTFCWIGPQGVGKDGVVTSKEKLSGKTTNRYECELYVDTKIISADCGCFIDDCVL